MTNEQVKAEWANAFDGIEHGAVLCESCGSNMAEYLTGSGFACESCADAAIEYGRIHVSEAYEE